MCPLKISAISFLNTAPLMWDFNHGATPEQHSDHDLAPELRADFTVEYTVPSRCAEDLQHGRADIGIIPAITYATIPGLVILPDAAIAAKGAVRSILLVARKPIQQVNTIAADTSSRSSVALARILCQKLWGRVRQFRALPPDLDSMLAACDAALLIGDAALRIAREQYFVYDLAEEWRSFTGKPFVFAFWAVRLQALNAVRRDLAAVFRNSRDHGIEPENVGRIARHWSPRVGLSEQEITSYLTRNIHFFLDAENLEGVELFFRYAVECGVIEQAPSLRFLGMAAPQFVG
ncbi:MAG: menaquinone biosynthesis protein [Acidobacteriia bacterium]|nr:menaquinone biosynthesis protein [Terriglobia bacterium]